MSFSLVHDTNVPTINTTIPITIPATTIGNVLVMEINNASGSPSPVSVSSIVGGGVGTWIKGSAQAGTAGGRNSQAEIWYGIVTSATLNTSVTVTHTIPSAVGNFNEFSWSGGTLVGSGLTVEAGTAGANGTTNTGTAINSGTITPTAGRDAILICTWGRNGSATKVSGPTNGFTNLAGATNLSTSVYLLAPSTTGSYSTAWVYTNNYSVNVVSFCCISLAGAPPPIGGNNLGFLPMMGCGS